MELYRNKSRIAVACLALAICADATCSHAETPAEQPTALETTEGHLASIVLHFMREISLEQQLDGRQDNSYILLKMNAPIPEDGYTYARYKVESIVSGRYTPGGVPVEVLWNYHRYETLITADEFALPGHFVVTLWLKPPAKRPESIEDLRIRLRVLRGRGEQRHVIGRLEQNETYEIGPFTLSNFKPFGGSFSIKVENKQELFKTIFHHSPRGNDYELRSFDQGILAEGTFGYLFVLPQKDSEFSVSGFEEAEYTTIELTMPDIPFSLMTMPQRKKNFQELFPEAFQDDVDDLSQLSNRDEVVEAVNSMTAEQLHKSMIRSALFDDRTSKRIINTLQIPSAVARRFRNEYQQYLDANAERVASELVKLALESPAAQSEYTFKLITYLKLRNLASEEMLQRISAGNYRGLPSVSDLSFLFAPATDGQLEGFRHLLQTSRDPACVQTILQLLLHPKHFQTDIAIAIIDSPQYSPYIKQTALENYINSLDEFPYDFVIPRLADHAIRSSIIECLYRHMARYFTARGVSEADKQAARKEAEVILPYLQDLAGAYPAREDRKRVEMLLEWLTPPE